LAGVVNLRGGVFTVVDLARFLGLRNSTPQAPSQGHARLVAFNAALGINGALMIDRLEGLRHAADLQSVDQGSDNASRPAFALARWRDAAGRWWQEIDLAALAQSPQFLAITA
jgi:twitching motility protein PilI